MDRVQEFFNILLSYLDVLPIRLLLCVSSSLGLITETVGQSIVQNLFCTIFKMENATFLLDNLFYKIHCEGLLGFQMGYKTYNYILEEFYMFHLSFRKVLDMLRFLIMDYFFGKSYSVLSHTNNLSTYHFDELRSCQSFQSHVDKTGDIDSVRDDLNMTRLLDLSRNKFGDWKKCFKYTFDVVWEVQSLIHSSLFQKSQHELVQLMLNPLFSQSEYFKTLIGLLKSKKNISFDEFDFEVFQEADLMSFKKCDTSAKVALFVKQFVESNLDSYSDSILFHEYLFFDDIFGLQSAFNPQIRACIQSALGDPTQYLSCSDCQSKDNHYPDVCILYKMYIECGKMINLYDWYNGFKMVISETKDEEAYPRFCQALSELKFAGFIKSTKRKVDHVLRTVMD